VLILNVVGGDENDEYWDAKVRGDKICMTERMQEGSPAVEKGKQ
jgi:hypothetical protein